MDPGSLTEGFWSLMTRQKAFICWQEPLQWNLCFNGEIILPPWNYCSVKLTLAVPAVIFQFICFSFFLSVCLSFWQTQCLFVALSASSVVNVLLNHLHHDLRHIDDSVLSELCVFPMKGQVIRDTWHRRDVYPNMKTLTLSAHSHGDGRSSEVTVSTKPCRLLLEEGVAVISNSWSKWWPIIKKTPQ